MDGKKKIISGMFWSFMERMMAQLVSLVISIILARLLAPSQYGIVSLVTIVIVIANAFVTDGFGSALIQKKKADAIDFSSVFYFGIVFSIVLYVILYFAAEPIANFYQIPLLVSVLRVLALKVPISAVNSVQQAYVSREMMFKKFFLSTLIGTVMSAIVGIAMAYSGYGVWALVAQDLTNTIVNTIVLWFTVRWRPQRTFSFERLKTLLGYGWKLLLQSLLNKIYANMRSLVIGRVYSSEDLAFYNRGSSYPNLIAMNVDTAMSKALFPAMSIEQYNLERIKAIARRSTKLCSYVMSPLLIGLAACSYDLVNLLLTDKWLPIIPFMRIISICLLIRAAQTSTLQAVKSTGRSDVVLKMDIPVRIIGLISLVIAVRYGVIYIAFSELIVEVFGLVLYGVACSNLIGYRVSELVWDFGINVIHASIMGIAVWGISQITNFSSAVTLFIQVVVGVVLYIAISYFARNENFIYVLAELKKLYYKRNIQN